MTGSTDFSAYAEATGRADRRLGDVRFFRLVTTPKKADRKPVVRATVE